MSFAGISVIGEATPRSASSAASIDTAAASLVMDSGYHLLLIQDYSRSSKDTRNGECIKSPPFNVGGYTWYIKYYPNGYDLNYLGYISMYLRLEDNNIADPVMAQFEFSFIDQVEKQQPSRLRTTRPRDFSGGNAWGRPQFARRADLERSKHLKNNSFVLRCDIIVGVSASSSVHAVSPTGSIDQHLSSLFLSGEGADVTFQVGDETIVAHRCVLACSRLGPLCSGRCSSGP